MFKMHFLITTLHKRLVFQTSLLFAKEEGLLSFLRKSLANESVGDVYISLLTTIIIMI